MNYNNLLNLFTNPQPIPSSFNEGFSQYETIKYLIGLINNLITNMNLGASEIDDLKNKKLDLERYLTDLDTTNQSLTNLQNTKVDKTDLKNNRKLDENGNFTGSWFGLSAPTLSEEGLRSAVEKIISDVGDITTFTTDDKTKVVNAVNEVLNKLNNHEVDINSKLNSITLNVKNFICDDGQYVQGNGTHDDTTGIISALNSSVGKILYFPNGDYLYTNDIYTPNDVHMKGDIKSKLICGTKQKGIYLGSNNIFEGFYVDGNSTNLGTDDQTLNTNVHPFGDNIVIRNNYFLNSLGSNVSSSSATNVLITQNKFNGWIDHAVYFSTTSSHEIQVFNNIFYGNGNGTETIKLREGCKNVIIKNNIALNVSAFCMFTAETNPCKNIIIEGNYALTKNHAILINRTGTIQNELISIKNNIFENYNLPTSYTAMSLSWNSLSGVKNIDIEGNVFKNYKDLTLKGESTDNTKLDNIKFINNTVIITNEVTSNSNMIMMYECTNASFKNNYLQNDNSVGYLIFGFDNMDIEISGNIFNANPSYFINFNNRANVNLDIHDNRLKCLNRFSFNSQITSGYVKIYNNRITSNEATYPYLYDRNVVTNHHLFDIHDNIVNGNTYYGNLSSVPTTGTWTKGRIIENSNFTAGSYSKWICVTAGTPGTWKGLGLIEA